jgi:hypothetical protein
MSRPSFRVISVEYSFSYTAATFRYKVARVAVVRAFLKAGHMRNTVLQVVKCTGDRSLARNDETTTNNSNEPSEMRTSSHKPNLSLTEISTINGSSSSGSSTTIIPRHIYMFWSSGCPASDHVGVELVKKKVGNTLTKAIMCIVWILLKSNH